MIPSGRQTGLQSLKQNTTVMHLLDDLKAFGHDLAALSINKQPVDRLAQLCVQARNAVQALKIVDHIQNQWRLAVSRC